MGFRIVNGSTHTEDGWRCCDREECLIVRIPELYLTDTAPIRKGEPHVILGAWMFWYDRNVEEITSPIWGWSLDNDVLGRYGENNGSNHLGGTAIDLNAPKYPWGTYRMSAEKIARVEEGRRLFEGSVFWGRVWSKPDEMHYQMAWPEGDPRNDPFAKKLLAGHLGIYKPAGASYGLPPGSNSGGYGGDGVRFPDWVYQLGNAFGIKPSTYPGHQETDRNEAGFAPNPQHLNRGIDWAAPGAADQVDRLQRFADYLMSIRGELEQVIWQNPNTGQRAGVAGGKDVTNTGYYDANYGGHRDHVHTRQSHPLPIPGAPPPPPVPTGQDAVALHIINVAHARGYDRPETIACLSTGLQESNLNPNAVDATGHRGVYQQDGGYPERGTMEGQVKGFFDRLDVKRASPGASQDIWLNIFWLQQRPSEKSADAAYANGRKAYLTEIKSRLPAAIVLYDRLAPSIGGDFMAALNEQEQRELLDRTRQLWGALFNENPSTSRYGDSDVVWPNHKYIRHIDGFLFDLITEHNAVLGDEWSLNQIKKKAAAGDKIAAAWLQQFNTPAPAPEPVPNPLSQELRDQGVEWTPIVAPGVARMPAPVPEFVMPKQPEPLQLLPVINDDDDDSKPPAVPSFSAAVEEYGGQMQQASNDFQKNLEQLRALLSRIIG